MEQKKLTISETHKDISECVSFLCIRSDRLDIIKTDAVRRKGNRTEKGHLFLLPLNCECLFFFRGPLHAMALIEAVIAARVRVQVKTPDIISFHV